MIVLTFPHVMVGRQVINKMIVLASSFASCKRVSLACIYYACFQHCGLLQVLQITAFVITNCNTYRCRTSGYHMTYSLALFISPHQLLLANILGYLFQICIIWVQTQIEIFVVSGFYSLSARISLNIIIRCFLNQSSCPVAMNWSVFIICMFKYFICCRGFDQVSDFDLMLMKKKEMSKKRKRKADIDIINDNDDIIDQLLADMKHAAEVSKSG